MNIEKVAQLAKLYATGAPPDKELREIKERANVAGNEIADKDNGAHLVPNDWGTASGLTRDPETGGGAFNQRIEMARKRPTFLTGLRAMKSSIRVFSRPSGFRSDQFVSDKARRSRSLALFFIAALIAVGATFAWHSQGDEGKEMVRRRWVSSLDWLLSMSTTKSPPAPVAASTSPELARPLEAVAPDLLPRHTPQSSPLPSKDRCTPMSLRRRGSSRTPDQRHRHLYILGRNALQCRRRDRQPSRAGCFAKLLMARPF